MLVTSQPYIRDQSGPRVISEVRKAKNCYDVDFRPRLSGELLVKDGNDKNWWPRRATIRNGQLNISGGENRPGYRLPLRGLSLRAGPLPNSLSLCKGPAVVLTMQTCSVRSFEAWVRTIAIELIRQTPFERVKHLEIFDLLYHHPFDPSVQVDCNANDIDSSSPSCEVELRHRLQQDVQEDECCSSSPSSSTDALSLVERLLKRCQEAQCYVPVRDKLLLFESLCKYGRKVRSSEDVSAHIRTRLSTPEMGGGGGGGQKRATSMHDLSNFTAVRDICKYFERVSDENKYGTITRFNRTAQERA